MHNYVLITLIAISFKTSILFGDASSIISPVKTDSPRATLVSFMEAMDSYHIGIKTKNEEKKAKIANAIKTLNLNGTAQVLRFDKGKMASIYLREVLDRVGKFDASSIPDDTSLEKWRYKGTDIIIEKVQADKETEYLFSKETIENAKHYYELVKGLPYATKHNPGTFYKTPWLEKHSPKWIKKSIFGVFYWQWLGLALAILIGLFIRKLSGIPMFFLNKAAQKNQSQLDDEIFKAITPAVKLLISSVFWVFSIKLLNFSGLLLDVLGILVQALISYALISMAYHLSKFITAYVKFIYERNNSNIDPQFLPMLERVVKITIIVFGTLIAVQNFGINVMSLIAGLGLGGLAFALAAKDTAANLFGSIMILSDNPFKVGDVIVADGTEGTVEAIGFRSTRVRTFYNSLITIPNANLANANIDNMGQRKMRRYRATLGLTYDTSPEKIEEFVNECREIIKNHRLTNNDNFNVAFYGYGDFSLNVLMNFFYDVKDWKDELDGRQEINLEILKMAKRIGVEFAFPTTTVHLEKPSS